MMNVVAVAIKHALRRVGVVHLVFQQKGRTQRVISVTTVIRHFQLCGGGTAGPGGGQGETPGHSERKGDGHNGQVKGGNFHHLIVDKVRHTHLLLNEWQK